MGRYGVGGKDGKEEGMGRRKGWEGRDWEEEKLGGGRDGEEEGMGRRKGLGGGKIGRRNGWGGGKDWEEGIGRKRRDGRRVHGIWEDEIVMTGRQDCDDGRTGFVWCMVSALILNQPHV